MACRLFGTKPISKLAKADWLIVNGNLGNEFQWDFSRNNKVFVEENAFECVVYKKSRPFCLGVNELKQERFYLC